MVEWYITECNDFLFLAISSMRNRHESIYTLLSWHNFYGEKLETIQIYIYEVEGIVAELYKLNQCWQHCASVSQDKDYMLS